MSELTKLIYKEYFLAKELDTRFCTKEESNNNLSMADGIQREALLFLIKYRTE